MFKFCCFKTEGGDDAASRGKLILLKKKLEERDRALAENATLLKKLEHGVNEKQLIIDTRERQLAEKGQLIVEKEDGERKMLAQLQEMEKVIEKREAVIEAMRSGGVVTTMGPENTGDDEPDGNQRLKALEVKKVNCLLEMNLSMDVSTPPSMLSKVWIVFVKFFFIFCEEFWMCFFFWL